MTLGREIEKFLDLSKIVYTQNFTNESNYIYFGVEGIMWTSNVSGDVVGVDEIILYGCVENPVLTNVGIPAKELHDIVSRMDNPVITQNDDHIVAKDSTSTVKLKSVRYTDPPVDNVSRDNWEKLPTLDPKHNKFLLEFLDKADINGSRIHCDECGPFSTDVNSIHLMSANFPFNMAVTPQVWNVLENFSHIDIEKNLIYLYNEELKITLITSHASPMEIDYIYDLMDAWEEGSDDFIEINIDEMVDSPLIKSFTASISKADRVITVSVKDEEIHVVAEDYRKGSVSSTIATHVEHTDDVKFKIHPDKLFACIKMGGVIRILHDTLWVTAPTGDKFVKIERVED